MFWVFWFMLMFSNKQSIFSCQIRRLSFPINWPSLFSTARSPIILWRGSDLINLRTNRIQINISSVTNVNKTYLVWLMYWLLFNQHYQHRTNEKLCLWANAVFQNRGVFRQAFPSFPSSSSPSFLFFALVPTFSTNSHKNAWYAG